MGSQTVTGTGSPQQPAMTPQQQAEFERAQKAELAKQKKVMAQLETITDPRQRIDLLVKNGMMSPAERQKALAKIALEEKKMEVHKIVLGSMNDVGMRAAYMVANGLMTPQDAFKMQMEAMAMSSCKSTHEQMLMMMAMGKPISPQQMAEMQMKMLKEMAENSAEV
jgi:hypothetical protein